MTRLGSALIDRLYPPPPPPDLASPAGFAAAHSRGQWRRAPHLDLIEAAVLDTIATGGRLIISVSVRHGKALDVDTPIATPDGWSRMGDLAAGDIVFDERGGPCTIVHAFDAYQAQEAYQVRFNDGSTIVTDGPHQWMTYRYREAQALGAHRRHNGLPNRSWGTDWATRHETPARSPKVRTTAEMRASSERFYVPNLAAPIETPDADLPVDPYLFGFWLGDGNSNCTNIATHPNDAPHIIAAANTAGWPADFDGNHTVRVNHVGPGGNNPLRRTMAAMGVLGNKHVPAQYLRASPSQRLALLQGLMDSDGGVERSRRNTGRVSFTNQTERLVDAVAELMVGLGAKVQRDQRPATISGRATGATAYRVSSSPPFQPFRLPRKADLWSDDSKGSLIRRTRAIDVIEPAGSRSVRCIAVDSPSRLYLAGKQMVPTHNSELASKWLPAWFLGSHPDKRVILAGHEADFAMRWGRAARDIVVEHGHRFGVQVSTASSAASRWDLAAPHTGGMLTVGVGGSPIGRGADLMIVDDPIKSYGDAMSPLVRSRLQEWWTGTMVSRIEPGGAVILIMARWHQDDLAGFLLREQPDKWRELRLPAIADDPNDPLGRSVGDPLWPEQWPLTELESRHAETALALGEAVWLAQYQQTPTTPGGGMFPEGSWLVVPAVDQGWGLVEWVRGWDLAATEGAGDFTVGALLGRLPDGRTVIADIVRGQWSAADVRARIAACAQADPVGTRIELPQDPGQAGKDQAEQLKAMLAGHRVRAEPQTGSKEVRAAGLAAAQQAGMVMVVAGPWVGDLIAEATGFPRATHDDQIDATATAFNALADTARPVVESRHGGRGAALARGR